MPLGGPLDEEEDDVLVVAESEEPEEQPVMVARAATPPVSSALFMNQRRLRSDSGVRGRCADMGTRWGAKLRET